LTMVNIESNQACLRRCETKEEKIKSHTMLHCAY
jgi:hypothetical protein